MSAAANSQITTIELNPALSPLARVKTPAGRSGYVHYSLLAKRLIGAVDPLADHGSMTESPLILPGKGLMLYPAAKIVAYLQAEPIKRIRTEDGEVSEPLTLCPLIWVWKFKSTPPHSLQHSLLFCAQTLPLLPSDRVAMRAWPFGNVHDNGEVCWGDVHTNHLTWERPEDVDALFWDSVPNTDLTRASTISYWVSQGDERPSLLSLVHGSLRSIQDLISQINMEE
jgi:hypothetical protein